MYEITSYYNNPSIVVEPGTYKILSTSRAGGIHPGYNNPDDYIILWNQPARLLYMALTGRGCEAEPEEATQMMALAARAEIRRMLHEPTALCRGNDNSCGWYVAAQAVAAWGNVIRPWLGTYRVERGRLITYDPLYLQFFNLATGKEEWPV